MPHLTVPEDTFRRLAAKAAALNISVDDLVQPALDRLAETGTSAPEPPLPLTGDAWHATPLTLLIAVPWKALSPV